MRRPHAVRMSGSPRRSATAARCAGPSAPDHSSQPSWEPGPGTARSSPSSAITPGPKSRLEPAGERLGPPRPRLLAREHRERAQRRVGHRLHVGVGERRPRRRAVGAHDAAAVGVLARRAHDVAPALLRQPAGALARAVAHEPAAVHQRLLEPRARRCATPARAPPSGPRRRRWPAAPGTTGSSRPSRSSAARRRAPASRARCARPAPRGGARAGSCPAARRSPDRSARPAARRARAASPPRPRAARAGPAAR